MKLIKKKINKVMLIFPPVVCSRECPKQIMAPLGIAYLAAVIKHDYQVKLLDAALEGYGQEKKITRDFFVYGLNVSEIIGRINEFQPDVVGISCLFSSQFAVVSEIFKAIKDFSKEIITVCGGAHPTFLPQECMASGNIDFIVRGEAEITLKKLLDCLSSGGDFENIDGLVFKQNTDVRINRKTVFIDDLDSIPFPERKMLDLDGYFKINLPMGIVSRQTPAFNMITSRGCVYDCSFCSSVKFWGNRYRARSAENVLNEMEYIKNALGAKEIKFFDDNLTLDKKRAGEIFEGMIKRRFNFTWNTPNGVDINSLDREMIKLMKRSGCYELTLAVESGDEQVLKSEANKHFDLKKVREVASWIKNEGLNTYGFFIIGFPGETKKQIFNTLDFINKIKLDRISLFIANPLPGTAIYDICKHKGYLAGNSADLSCDYFSARFDTDQFSRKFLEIARRNCYWKYNIKLLLRNPIRFFLVYRFFIFKKPLFLFEVIINKFIKPSLIND
ncbi:MAG: cobalamin B12-binding domain-containing protein [Candidatus Omnitrophica bacterium]|nr:cobalamin B12-binding domain-containing protein [Candidatus Omnitrophota bacterium]